MTEEYNLRAMALNYKNGHSWDHLDGDVCSRAADEIKALQQSLLRMWKPIEIAPRIYNPPLSHINHHAPQILGLWGRSFYSVCSWGGSSNPYWIGEDNKMVPFQPTRWMRLPSPPPHT